MEWLPLAGLALIDALSGGALLVPLIYLARPRPRPLPLFAYMVTVITFYWGVGLALAHGLDIASQAAGLLESRGAYWLQLVVGVALFAWGVLSREPDKERSAKKWRSRLDRNLTVPVMITIGLLAGVAELVTMLPYLAAVGMIANLEPSPAGRALLLAAYCLIMFAPAAVVWLLRTMLGRRGEETIDRFATWVAGQTDVTLLWVAGVAGFLLAGHAAGMLFR